MSTRGRDCAERVVERRNIKLTPHPPLLKREGVRRFWLPLLFVREGGRGDATRLRVSASELFTNHPAVPSLRLVTGNTHRDRVLLVVIAADLFEFLGGEHTVK
jgi:hypothetical protein